MKRQQYIRVEKLAFNLKQMLERYTQGDTEGFKVSVSGSLFLPFDSLNRGDHQPCGLCWQAAMTEEAGKLVKTSFGDTLLHTIGEVYEQQADIMLSNFFGALGARFKASSGNVK